MINSKLLFQQLLGQLTMKGDLGEREAVLYLVLEHQYHLSRMDVTRGKEASINESALDEIIFRLNKNEPVQYVLGEAHFYGRNFQVNSSVLIPRPETELLIDLAGSYIKTHKQNISILDIGTGSGCIAISLALEFPSANVFATDISREALVVANENAKRLKAKVQFYRDDILNDAFPFEPLDLIISNPPYIMESERGAMQRNVVDHEPKQALFVPDETPLLFYERLAERGKKLLTPGGALVVEINERFGKETAGLFSSLGYSDVKIHKDLDGKERAVFGGMK
jgi:release factor glutamine methyltransferase